MITITRTPFLVLFLGTIIVFSVFKALKNQKWSLMNVSLSSALWASLFWVVIDTFVYGISALWAITFVEVYIAYFLIALVVGLLSRLLMRRRLYLLRGEHSTE